MGTFYNGEWILSDSELKSIFDKLKEENEAKMSGLRIHWFGATLSEVMPAVARSLKIKYPACNDTDGYRTAKVAGAYTFWISKLKPVICSPYKKYINELFAIQTGITIVNSKKKLEIAPDEGEITYLLETLRFHTSSPRMMMHLFESWIAKANASSAKSS